MLDIEDKFLLPTRQDFVTAGELIAANAVSPPVTESFSTLVLEGPVGTELAAQGKMLRVRIFGEPPVRAEMALRSLSSGDGPMLRFCSPVALSPADAAAVVAEPTAAMSRLAAARPIVASLVALGVRAVHSVGVFGTKRTAASIRLPASGAASPPLAVKLDECTYPDGSVDYELEVALNGIKQFPDEVEDLVGGALRRAGAAFTTSPPAKHERLAVALHRMGHRRVAPSATPTPFDPPATAEATPHPRTPEAAAAAAAAANTPEPPGSSARGTPESA